MGEDIKLYLWDDVLERRQFGVAFALASDKNNAIDLIINNVIKECKDSYGECKGEKCNSCFFNPDGLKEELEKKEAKILDDGDSFFLNGGDW